MKRGIRQINFSETIPNSNTHLARPYTIRNFRKEKLEIDIDFVVHNEKRVSFMLGFKS